MDLDGLRSGDGFLYGRDLGIGSPHRQEPWSRGRNGTVYSPTAEGTALRRRFVTYRAVDVHDQDSLASADWVCAG